MDTDIPGQEITGKVIFAFVKGAGVSGLMSGFGFLGGVMSGFWRPPRSENPDG